MKFYGYQFTYTAEVRAHKRIDEIEKKLSSLFSIYQIHQIKETSKKIAKETLYYHLDAYELIASTALFHLHKGGDPQEIAEKIEELFYE